jgi:hypothetical protein
MEIKLAKYNPKEIYRFNLKIIEIIINEHVTIKPTKDLSVIKVLSFIFPFNVFFKPFLL